MPLRPSGLRQDRQPNSPECSGPLPASRGQKNRLAPTYTRARRYAERGRFGMDVDFVPGRPTVFERQVLILPRQQEPCVSSKRPSNSVAPLRQLRETACSAPHAPQDAIALASILRPYPGALPGGAGDVPAAHEAVDPERPLLAYSVEKLCFEGAANGSGPLERSQSCAHGGVPATHHLSPTSRCGACRVARDPSSPTAQQSRRIRRPSEIEFFNRIGPIRSFGRSVAIASKPTFVRADRVANAGAAKSHASTRRVRFPLTSPSPSYRCDVPS